jgi:NRAMP (natural resistance-associated macrophage protein)-like metal ion transporter
VSRLNPLRALSSRRGRFLILLGVIGPGIITQSVDNDATGITGYALAGSQYGFNMLWLLIVITFALALVQEMSARMGTITGKGLSDLIRERFGVRITLLAMVLLFVANVATTGAEFAGIAASVGLFGISRYVAVPLAAVAVWFLVLRGTYRQVEKLFLVLTLVFFSYVISGFLAHPNWAQVAHDTVVPSFRLDGAFITAFVAVIGTTITPWMAFYQQSAVADKGLTAKELPYERVDTFVGAFLTDFIAFFIIVATGATIFAHHIPIDAGDPEAFSKIALSLKPLAGVFAQQLFALGLLNASLMAAVVLPLTTTYAITEAFGWERGVGRRFREAPAFIGIYTAMIIIGALVVLIPGAALGILAQLPNIINGVLLPPLLLIMLLIINDRRVMGRYVNGPVANVASWVTVGFVILLTILLLLTNLAPSLFGK